jgi:glycosyltransferase involved in cell wall biosynthesis
MNIVLLAHYYPPEMGGAAARLHGLSRWLVRYGHHVTVITGFPNYPSGVIPLAYRGKLRMREEIDGVDVIRTWLYASSHKGSVRRLANYFSFVASSTLSGLSIGGNYDVVLASSPPPFVGLVGVILARLHRIPLVLDIRDIWPDVAIESKVFASDAFMARAGRWLARFLYRQADHVTPVTENKRKKLINKGVPSEKLTVVANGVDLDKVTLMEKNKIRKTLGLDGEFVVLYAGLIGHAQGVGIAVGAAEQLSKHQDVHFLIVGDGVRREALLQRVAERDLDNVTMLPRQPREKIPAFLAAADACLVPLANAEIKTAVPSKLLETWAYRRPVILSAAGEPAELVRLSGGGVVIPPGDPSQLAETVLELKDDQERLDAYAERGHAYVRQHFDRRALARQMENVLQRVLDERQDCREGQSGVNT